MRPAEPAADLFIRVSTFGEELPMKSLYLLVASCALTTLASCASTGEVEGLRERSMRIQHGTSAQDVLALLGPPGDRSFNGKAEAWQYCSTGWDVDQYITVWFYDDSVYGLSTYHSESRASCTSAFVPINWGGAPDDIRVKVSIEGQ
jgi:hypothetical protein